MSKDRVLSEEYVRKRKISLRLGMTFSLLAALVLFAVGLIKHDNFALTISIVFVAMFVMVCSRWDSLIENHEIYKAVAKADDSEKKQLNLIKE